MADPTASLAALGLTAKGGREARITGLAVDSRAVRSGFLFAALPGTAATFSVSSSRLQKSRSLRPKLEILGKR